MPVYLKKCPYFPSASQKNTFVIVQYPEVQYLQISYIKLKTRRMKTKVYTTYKNGFSTNSGKIDGTKFRGAAQTQQASFRI